MEQLLVYISLVYMSFCHIQHVKSSFKVDKYSIQSFDFIRVGKFVFFLVHFMHWKGVQ